MHCSVIDGSCKFVQQARSSICIEADLADGLCRPFLFMIFEVKFTRRSVSHVFQMLPHLQAVINMTQPIAEGLDGQ